MTSTPNAKTVAAARIQAPIVADNLIAQMKSAAMPQAYDGYGSVPADGRARQVYSGGVRLWRKTHAQLSLGQHQAKTLGLFSKEISAAMGLLECHAERQRVVSKNDFLNHLSFMVRMRNSLGHPSKIWVSLLKIVQYQIIAEQFAVFASLIG